MGRDWKGLLAILGPGMLVAATGVGAGDLATAALTGNRLGVGILWAVVAGAFLKYVLNEGLARWQLATGTTLLEGAMTHLGWPFRFFFGLYLLFWSFFVGAALMGACGVAAHALFPVFDRPETGKIVFGILHSALGAGLAFYGGYRLFEKAMSACIGLMFLSVVTTAPRLVSDWGAVMQGLLVPTLPEAGGEGLSWTVALIGGVGGTLTVLCYGYWIREEGREGPGQLSNSRLDLGAGYLMTAVFGLGMVIIGSTVTVEGQGAGLVVALGQRLETVIGPWGKWIFLTGAWGAVFSSLLGVWQSVPYVFADFWSQLTGKGTATTRSPAYRLYLVLLAVVPMTGLFYSFQQMQKFYAVIGAAFMPLLAVVLLILNNRLIPKAMRNGSLVNLLLSGILLLMLWVSALELGIVQ